MNPKQLPTSASSVANECNRLHVTHVEALGPYLKIHGQLNPDAMEMVRSKLRQLEAKSVALDPSWPMSRQQALIQGTTLCLYKRIKGAAPADYEIYRVRVLNSAISGTQTGQPLLEIEVEFIDYGYTGLVTGHDILFPPSVEVLQQIPLLCCQFILLGICTDWQQSELDEILRMVRHQTLDIFIQTEFNGFKFIAMKWKGFSFSEFLIHQKKIGAPISNELLCDDFLKSTQRGTNGKSTNGEQRTINNNYIHKNNNNNNNDKDNNHGGNPVREQLAHSRALAARLQRYQMPMQVRSELVSVPTTQPGFASPHTPPRMQLPHSNGLQQQHFVGYAHPQVTQTPVLLQYLPQQTLPSATLAAVPQNVYIVQKQSLPFAPTAVVPLRGDVAGMSPQRRRNVVGTYAYTTLRVGQTYEGSVSYVENGPCLFSVQLTASQAALTEMMDQIERSSLQPFSKKPTLGMPCIALYPEDRQFYRACITAMQALTCKVFYVDYGNSALVNFDDLYEISEELLKPKAFAMRFTLSGHKALEPIDESLKRTFKDLVMYRSCTLKVMPLEGPPIVQYCELHMQNQSIMDVLQQIQKSRLVYPKAENLQNNDAVEIRYIDSPKHFYVQKVQNVPIFEKLMDDMFLYYNKNQVVPQNLVLGAPCIVKYENEWYRAEIMRADSSAIVVRHIDFGYEQKVTQNLLSNIAEKHLLLPRQAVQCCLKGFEKTEIDREKATTQFEMLAEESTRKRRTFTVKVFRIQPDGVNLVNLFTKELNVMKKLFKLSIPFEDYLALERREFNVHGDGRGTPQPPSIASSNDGVSVSSSGKGIILHSTTLQSDDQRQRPQQQQQQQPPMKPRNPAKNSAATEWDKRSSASSVSADTRDSRSSSTEQRQGRRTQPPHGGRNAPPQQPAVGVPPRQRLQGQEKTPPQSQQRPQNAPKGYSQQRHLAATDSASSYTMDPPSSSASSMVSVKSKNTPPSSTGEYLPLDCGFPVMSLGVPSSEEVLVSWWISPHQFYVQLKSRQHEFEQIMEEMAEFYATKTPKQLKLKNGANIVARNRKERSFYRARILACNQMQRKYKVLFVDVGKPYTVSSEDIWPVDRRFSTLPCLAHLCGINGIVSNVDHLYIVDLMGVYLPVGAKIVCQFQKRVQDLYQVDLSVGGVLLKESLKAAGLVSEIGSDLRLEFLAGQQIRARITAVKDMLNFKIILEDLRGGELQLLCAYDDVSFVKSNKKLAEKFKSFYENKSCVINIKAVNENKVVLLRPLMPLFEQDLSTQICPRAVLLESFEAHVSFVSSHYRIYVQPKELLEKLTTLMKEMHSHYAKKGASVKVFELEQICAVKGADGNWYRGRIVAAAKEALNLVDVFCIDYGKVERVDKSQLRELAEEFYVNQSAYAIEINLPLRPLNSSNQNYKKLIAELEALTINSTFIVHTCEIRRNRLIADLSKTDVNSLVGALQTRRLIKGLDLEFMRKQLDKELPNKFAYIETVDLTLDDEESNEKAAQVIVKTEPTTPKKQPQEKVAEVPRELVQPVVQRKDSPVEQQSKPKPIVAPAPQLEEKPAAPKVEAAAETPDTATPPPDPLAHLEQAVLSHCDNPAQFFIHPMEKLPELRKLQENLQIVSTSLPPLLRCTNGAHCISLYSVDKQWYRAQIMDAELMVLKFIDYGNTDCVSDTTDVKEMSVFPDIAPLCLPCALPIKPNGTADWVDAANAIFNDSYQKVLRFEFIVRGDEQKRSFIKLFIDGVSVADQLIANGFAQPLELVASGENCYISHVNAINDFYIQYEKDAKTLELLELYFAQSETQLRPLERFERSKIVAAVFRDDGLWYRARLIREAEAAGSYEVLFIDFGNTSISTKVCEISSPEIVEIAPLSKKCALELPESSLAWSEQAEEKFGEIAALGETIFTVELREPSTNYALVQLLVDGRSVNDELAALCERRPAPETPAERQAVLGINSAGRPLHEATVLHVNSPGEFFLLFDYDAQRHADMTAALNGQEMGALCEPQVGQMCAARYNSDAVFYRARILEILHAEKKEFRVHFVDFGNEAISQDLRELPEDMRDPVSCTKRCRLEYAEFFSRYGGVVLETFHLLINECAGLVKVELLQSVAEESSPDAGTPESGLNTAGEEPTLVKLYAARTEESIDKKLQRLLGFDPKAPPPVVIAPTPKDTCLISHALSPKHFYIQLKADSAQMEVITRALQEEAKNATPLEEGIVSGGLYSAYSTEDDCWYRGRLISTVGGDHELQLLDYGNTLRTKKLQELPKDLSSIPPLALRCRLSEIPDVSDALLDERFAALIEAHFGEVYSIEEDRIDKDTGEKDSPPLHIVQLQVNYKDLAAELASAVADSGESLLAASILHPCCLIHVNSPASFYIQHASDVAQIEKITDVLLDAEAECPALVELKPGVVCAAQFPEDMAFYRAEIVKVLEGGKCEVHFVDFGNDTITDQLRQLPEELAKLPSYGKHCALEGGFVSEAATLQFSELIDSRFSETFQVEYLRTSVNPNLCRLFYQEKNVSEELTQRLRANVEEDTPSLQG